MKIKGWEYYNHAAIPSVPPHEEPDLTPIKDKSIWKIDGGTPLLARWTTDFDCGYETNWWYVIKDDPFDISKLKSNYRYKINKGNKHFDVHIIDPKELGEELYDVQVAAFSAYPAKYRPTVDKCNFIKEIENWGYAVVFGAFYKETGKLVGYCRLTPMGDRMVYLSVQKTNPEYEKFQLNAALVENVLSHYSVFLSGGGMICDGARSIAHETNFQDYLEKYFGFRKSFCRLNVEYNPKIKWIVKALFPLRRLLCKLDMIGLVHQINGVLIMEEICRHKEQP